MAIFRHKVSGPGAAGDVWNSTFHSSSGQSIDTVHTAFVQWCTDFLAGVLALDWSTATQATQAQTDQLELTSNKNVLQRVSSLSIAGGVASPMPTPRASVVVGLRTVVPTRAGRGRMYLPAPAAASLQTDGLLTVATAAAIASGAKTAFGTFNATSQLVVYHRLTFLSTPVTGITVSPVLGTQRRRTNKVPADYQTETL